MTIYNLYVFDRHCKCVYYTSWNRAPAAVPPGKGSVPGSQPGIPPRTASMPGSIGGSRQTRPGNMSLDEEAKLVYGVIYSLRNMVNKLKGSSELGSFLAYRTNAYKLHYFETATGLKFVMCTDPNLDGLAQALRTIYSQMYVEYVAKNPLARSMDTISNDLFRMSVDRYVQSLPGFG
ncbi:Sybindin-like protein [Hyaloraphidium curvatum]|nr:Sybindin-like protein [Hyaloraphidium curvatum]